jgi:hypothetical protein
MESWAGGRRPVEGKAERVAAVEEHTGSGGHSRRSGVVQDGQCKFFRGERRGRSDVLTEDGLRGQTLEKCEPAPKASVAPAAARWSSKAVRAIAHIMRRRGKRSDAAAAELS